MRKKRTILPLSSSLSLITCLPALLTNLGWKGNQESLNEVLALSNKELTLSDILIRLERLGYYAQKTRFTRKTLRSVPLPGLMMTSDGLYAAILRSEEDGLLTYFGEDQSYRIITIKELYKTYKACLYVYFYEGKVDQDGTVSSYWIQNLLSRLRGPIGIALGYSFVLAVFGILTPIFIKLLYQQIDLLSEQKGILMLGLGALLFVLGEHIFYYIRLASLDELKTNLLRIFNNEVLRRIIYFPLNLNQTTSVGAQQARIREFEDLAIQISRPVTLALLDLPFLPFLLIALGIIGGGIVIIPLVTIALFLLFSTFLYPLLKKTEQEASIEQGVAQTNVDAVLRHSRLIQRLGIEEYWKTKLLKTDLDAIPLSLKKNRLASGLNFISHAMVSLSGVLTVFWGVFQIFNGTYDSASLLASMVLVWRILDPCRSVFVLLGAIQNSAQAIKRLQKFMALKGESQPDQVRQILRLSCVSIRFDSFYYKYPQTNRFALSNISLEIQAGKLFFVSGHSGSGKTTLAQALLGLVEANSGRILFGGKNIMQYDPIQYRKNIAFLPAKVPILPVSIRENLLLAKADVSDTQVWEVLNRCGLEDVVKTLPDGIDTQLNSKFILPRTDFFRCIGLLRVLLKDSPLIIIDSPELDFLPDMRRFLCNYLQELKGRSSCLLLSNDSDFMAIADQKAVMDLGRL